MGPCRANLWLACDARIKAPIQPLRDTLIQGEVHREFKANDASPFQTEITQVVYQNTKSGKAYKEMVGKTKSIQSAPIPRCQP